MPSRAETRAWALRSAGNVVEAHGGRIRARERRSGHGRAIHLLPADGGGVRVHIPGDRRSAVTRPSRRSARERVRILVLDDDPTALRYTRDALTDAGYEVMATTDPEESVRLMETRGPIWRFST